MTPRDDDDGLKLDDDLRLGDFIVRAPLKQILKRGDGDAEDRVFNLPDKAMAVLVFLAENARRVCDRDDILDAVWGDERQAYDRVLDNAIAEIRRALGDDARSPTYIQTVPKRGYRLLRTPAADGGPREFSRSSAIPPKLDQPSGEERLAAPTRRIAWVAAGVVLSLVTTAAVWFIGHGVLTVEPALFVEVDLDSNQDADSFVSKQGIREVLFESHSCAEYRLLRPAGWFKKPNLKILLAEDPDSGSRTATARIDSSLGLQPEFVRTGLAGIDNADVAAETAEVFSESVRSAVDRLVCNIPDLQAKARACHCLSSAESPASSVNRPTDIVQRLETAIELDPDLMPAYDQLAASYYRMADHQNEVKTLTRGMSRLPSLDSIEGLELRRSLARATTDFKTEWDLIVELVERDPTNWTRELDKARFLTVHRLECSRALKILKELERVSPSEELIQFEFSRSLVVCRQPEAAISRLRKTLQQSPRNTSILSSLVVFTTFAGHYNEARALALDLLALQPTDPGPYWMLGGIALDTGRYAESQHWLDLALELSYWPSDRGYIYSFLADIAWKRGDFETCLSMATKAEPFMRRGSFSTGETRGRCLLDSGQLDAAKEVSERLKDLAASRDTLNELWMVLILQGSIQATEWKEPNPRRPILEVLDRAVALNPLSPDAGYFAGRASELIKDLVRARQFYGAALGVNPNYPWALCQLGLLDQRQDRIDEAIENMRHAIEVFGNPPEDPLGMQCAEALADLDPTFTVAN